jgi:hypothetical protein
MLAFRSRAEEWPGAELKGEGDRMGTFRLWAIRPFGFPLEKILKKVSPSVFTVAIIYGESHQYIQKTYLLSILESGKLESGKK